MEYVKEKAIILSNRDFGEADRLVAFLTMHHGKIVGIAKHARKSKRRFVNSLDVFSLVKIEYGEKRFPGLVFIKKAVLEESFTGLREDVLKLSCAGLIAEAIRETVPERESQPEIFDLLCESLKRLETTKDPVNIVCLSLWKLLQMLGLMPRLGSCLVCKQKNATNDVWYFDCLLGGTVCRNHARGRQHVAKLNKGIISLLNRVKICDLHKLWRFRLHPEDAVQLLRVLVQYIEFHIDKGLKSMYVISQLGYGVTKINSVRASNNKNSVLSC